MTSRLAGERGSVTAEFAVTLPAVLLVVMLALGAVQAASQQLRLQDAAADAARSLARGDDRASAASTAGARVPGSALAASTRGVLRCATLTARLRGPMGAIGLTTSATSCALDGGL